MGGVDSFVTSEAQRGCCYSEKATMNRIRRLGWIEKEVASVPGVPSLVKQVPSNEC